MPGNIFSFSSFGTNPSETTRFGTTTTATTRFGTETSRSATRGTKSSEYRAFRIPHSGFRTDRTPRSRLFLPLSHKVVFEISRFEKAHPGPTARHESRHLLRTAFARGTKRGKCWHPPVTRADLFPSPSSPSYRVGQRDREELKIREEDANEYKVVRDLPGWLRPSIRPHYFSGIGRRPPPLLLVPTASSLRLSPSLSLSLAAALDDEQINTLRKTFQMFDSGKTGLIDCEKVRTILNTMGQQYDADALEAMLETHNIDGSGKINFDGFCEVVGHFLEEEDSEAMQQELKEAFRLYDKEGNGYIPTSCLREILAALDDKLTSEQLDEMIDEIDTDGSGTVDFEEFMEMMTGE
ncbi:unnamed protein product [Darwinula stevensoni]|uniref:EF-hand domain-containing protein n=1 Tax=Darwinula stevensoni TaxID=69355 RepID=A0A7R8ZY47_9CRUS|nr:unnamed protein product [Darwinula stevensoni]CAG0880808.1 unnamed protein product [Darwinula stevensoni]